MLTTADLNSAVAAATWRQNISQVVAFLWMPLAGALGWCFKPTAEALAFRWMDEVSARLVLVAVLGLVMGVPAILIVVVGSFRNERLDRADGRLSCPACGETLLAMHSLVVATRNCGHCGKKILHDGDRGDPDQFS